MKKLIILAVLTLLAFASSVKAATPTPTMTPINTPTVTRPTQSNGPPMTLYGGDFFNGSQVGLARNAYAQGTIVLPYIALVNIAQGDVVTLAAPVSGYPGGVTETTTAGDVKWLGVAVESATYGQRVRVAVKGKVRANVAINVTANDPLSPSGTAGKLTETSSLTAGTYTSLSRSPIVGIALETNVATEQPLIYLP